MMSKLLSIVIPTYNMENYLQRCLDSLLVEDKRLFEMLEVWVINDGSKDRSSVIAHGYGEKYSGVFKVLDKENGNYGSCINAGLKVATGKYIKILDADDYFDTDILGNLLEKLEAISDTDLILTDYSLVDNEGKEIEYRSFNITPLKEHQIESIQHPLSEIEMHAIIYRRQMLIDMAYKQTEGISYTDTEWAYIPLQSVNNVFYMNETLYQYFVGREGQTMDQSVLIRSYGQMLRVYKHLLEIYRDNNLKEHKAAFIFYKRPYSFFSRFFSSAILDNTFSTELAVEQDELLNKCAPDIYTELDKLQFSKIAYLHIWRNNDYKLPMSDRVMIRIIKYKQKHFPNLSLGRLK